MGKVNTTQMYVCWLLFTLRKYNRKQKQQLEITAEKSFYQKLLEQLCECTSARSNFIDCHQVYDVKFIDVGRFVGNSKLNQKLISLTLLRAYSNVKKISLSKEWTSSIYLKRQVFNLKFLQIIVIINFLKDRLAPKLQINLLTKLNKI